MPTKDAAADYLIRQHFEVEPGLVCVYRVFSDNEDDPDEPIKLVEINTETVTTGYFEAFGFAPSRTVPFRTVIAEVTPDELEGLQREGRWPPEWDLTKAREYRREPA